MYPLVLANLMSPVWKWRKTPVFHFPKLTPYRHLAKQYIMDHYVFNLDLEHTGPDHAATRAGSFRAISLAGHLPKATRSSATRRQVLFCWTSAGISALKYRGYHPVLENGNGQAMDAFAQPATKPGRGHVLLSPPAALYILCGISLDDIFWYTLHSRTLLMSMKASDQQPAARYQDMWFNGTELSASATRAGNEQVTIVAHHTGWVHTVYPRPALIAYPDAGQTARSQDSRSSILFNFLPKARPKVLPN